LKVLPLKTFNGVWAQKSKILVLPNGVKVSQYVQSTNIGQTDGQMSKQIQYQYRAISMLTHGKTNDASQ